MFPFNSRFKWLLSNKYLHTVEATEGNLTQFEEPYVSVARNRIKSMRFGLKVRAILLVLLYPPIIGLVVSWVSSLLPGLDDVEETIRAILRIATTLSLIIGAAFLLVTRYVEQLQADLNACLALGLARHDEKLEK